MKPMPGPDGRRPTVAAALALAASLALAACAGSGPAAPQSVQPPVPPEDCATLHVVAPGNFIIDLASGAEVVLDPSVREFPLFCGPDTAAQALKAALASGRLPAGDWRIYRLEGGFTDLVQTAEPGGPSPYALARQARLADWVDGDAAPAPGKGKRQ